MLDDFEKDRGRDVNQGLIEGEGYTVTSGRRLSGLQNRGPDNLDRDAFDLLAYTFGVCGQVVVDLRPRDVLLSPDWFPVFL